jgi:hypothetical protein
MKQKINPEAVYTPSNKVVTREIEGEIIIIPLISGLADVEDELYTLNDTGKAIWKKLDGKKDIRKIAKELSLEFKASQEDIERDTRGLLKELLKRRMVVEVSKR